MNMFKLEGGQLVAEIPALSKLGLLSVTTDAQIHQPGEQVHFLIAGPTCPGKTVRLEISFGGNVIWSQDVSLDDQGVALVSLDWLTEGEYIARVTEPESGLSAEHQFIVAPYSRAVLQLKLESHAVEEGKLRFQAKASRLGLYPYTGRLKLALRCAYCHGKVVAEQEAEIRDGLLEAEFAIEGHIGPFTVNVTTPEGDTGSLFFPGTEREVRERIETTNFGRKVETGLHPFGNSVGIRGLQVGHTAVANDYLLIQGAIAEPARLVANMALPEVLVVAINPVTGEQKEHRFANVQKNQILDVPIEAPYSVLVVGVLTEEPKAGKKPEIFAGYGIVYRPVDLSASLELPQEVAPGDNVTCRIQTNRPTSCVVVVCDRGVEQRRLQPKLAQSAFETVQGQVGMLKAAFAPPSGDISRGFASEDERTRSAAPPIRHFAAVVELGVGGAALALAPSAPRVRQALSLRVAGRDLPVLLAPPREEELHVVCVQYLQVEGEDEISFQAPDQIGQLEAVLYAFSGLDWRQETQNVAVTKSAWAEPDLPPYAEESDSISVQIAYNLEGQGVLRVSDGQEESHQVEGQGQVTHLLAGPGEVRILLDSPAGTDRVQRLVKRPGRATVTQSQIRILSPGETVTGDRVAVFLSPLELQREAVEGLCRYPHGCAEQTTAALYGCGVGFSAYRGGLLTGGNSGLGKIREMISAGRQRLLTEYGAFAETGSWGLWENSPPSLEVSRKVARNLVPFGGSSDFPELAGIAARTAQNLLRERVKDNELLPLDPQFLEEGALDSVESAAAVALYSEGQVVEQVLEYLRQQAEEHGDGTCSWPATRSWAGSLEATCWATAALFRAGDPLAQKGFAYVVSQRLSEGRLYSTSDTAALIAMLGEMRDGRGGQKRVVIDGLERDVDQILVGQNVTCQSGRLMVRVDREVEVNYLDVEPAFPFEIELRRGDGVLKLGNRLDVVVRPREQSRCPIARVYLPGMLAFLEGGANVQMLVKPVIGHELVLPAVVVRKGSGCIHAVLSDMYDSKKVGTIPAMPLSVE